MATTRTRHTAFTLVEILIVVMILGILAAITIPMFNSFTSDSKSATTKAVLKTAREQLQLYYVNHQDQFPSLTQMWTNMTTKTLFDGTVDASGRFGPYLMQAPVNQYTSSSTIVAIGSGTANDGWEYDENTGRLLAVGFNEDTGVYTPP